MVRPNREYRFAPMFEIRKEENGEENYIVEGYATTFDDEYVLWTDEEGREYREKVSSSAIDEKTDIKDVIFLKDHEGTVFARTRNGSLKLSMDEHGLKVVADLSLTSSARSAYEEIKAGMYDQMSFAFVVDDEEYDSKSRVRTIKHIRKIYDTSFVGFPANPNTDISTRSLIDGFVEIEEAERLKREEESRKLELAKLKLKAILDLEV